MDERQGEMERVVGLVSRVHRERREKRKKGEGRGRKGGGSEPYGLLHSTDRPFLCEREGESKQVSPLFNPSGTIVSLLHPSVDKREREIR